MLFKHFTIISLASFLALPLQAWSLVNALDQDMTQEEALVALSWIQKKKSPGIFKTALGKVTTKYFKGNESEAKKALAEISAPAAVPAVVGLPADAAKHPLKTAAEILRKSGTEALAAALEAEKKEGDAKQIMEQCAASVERIR